MNERVTYKRFSLHLLYWLLSSFLFPVFYNIFVENDYELYLFQIRNFAIGNIYVVPATYFVAYFLIPRVLLKDRKYFLFAFLYLATFLLITSFDVLLYYIYIIPKDYPDKIFEAREYFISLKFLVKAFFVIHLEVFIFVSFRFFIQYIRTSIEKQNLQKDISRVEFKALNGQLNPHFLFNTLNNINSMYADNSKFMVSDTIDRMSRILRYSLYECDSELIKLKNEIKIIEDYIELEKIRYSNVDIDFKVDVKSADKLFIVPLLLFTFVENAFKHGAGKSIENRWVHIDLEASLSKLHFVVKNSINPDTPNNKNIEEGLGLKNAIKRMNIIYGEENYTLRISDKVDMFEVQLVIYTNN